MALQLSVSRVVWSLALIVSTVSGSVSCGGDPSVASSSGQSGSASAGTGSGGVPMSSGGLTIGVGAEPNTGTAGEATAECTGETGDCVYTVVDMGPYCGDGALNNADEECDDGNLLPGDGCSGVCKGEPNADCPATGGPCVSTVACGNATRDPGEACDDGNTKSGDGCAADCSGTDPGYYCPTPGAICQKLVNCGDGRLQTGEACDDKNNVDNDGCTKDCTVEPGFRCLKPGTKCETVPVCGDGKVQGAEDCDDGGTDPGDGCSAICRKEASFYNCPPLGGPCVKTVKCSDGKVEDTEQCDDGNTANFDGCSATCFIDAGWKCPVPGQKCVPSCGDGKKLAVEGCDDGNSTSGDGCSSTCRLEPGYVCGTVGMKCQATVCGDGKVEGTELCDAGSKNGLFSGNPAAPGCSLNCTPEPKCRDANGTTHACASTCGDGMKLGAEACDDGNLSDGDGCSSSCSKESGFTCTTKTSVDTVPCSSGNGQCLVIPITYRDFHGLEVKDGTAHPDFFYLDPARPNVTTTDGTVKQPSSGSDQLCPGLASATLDAQGKPTRANSGSNCGGDAGYLLHSDASFSQWYRNTAGTNQTSYSTIELSPIGGGQYRFDQSNFFPLDGKAWGAEPAICASWPYWTQDPNTCGAKHNFHFTSEVRYLFPYRGGETLSFYGDDDVWVFVNGKLAVDLGGVHQQQSGSITINAGNQANYGMVPNSVYEIAVFQAERHPIASNYQLTLSGFQTDRSACAPTCGDGVATVFEECDNGAANSDSAYGGCKTNCTFGPRCGDGKKDAQEACDDGKNSTTAYGAVGCAPGCKLPPDCGDGKLDLGEECDAGAANSDAAYDGCSTACTLGPYCGDGAVQASFLEQCDDGLNIGGYGQCDVGCKLGERCGDGKTQAANGELCDDGADNGKAGKCTKDCGLAAVCGDAIVQVGEQCDSGMNDNSYGGCAVDCVYGPRCGDSVVQANQGEQCDSGSANKDGLYGGCSTQCKYGPHCGDGVKQVGTSEQCDDGNNTSGDGCSAACKTEVKVPR
jgi:fibro-slime domain-containing protein